MDFGTLFCVFEREFIWVAVGESVVKVVWGGWSSWLLVAYVEDHF